MAMAPAVALAAAAGRATEELNAASIASRAPGGPAASDSERVGGEPPRLTTRSGPPQRTRSVRGTGPPQRALPQARTGPRSVQRSSVGGEASSRGNASRAGEISRSADAQPVGNFATRQALETTGVARAACPVFREPAAKHSASGPAGRESEDTGSLGAGSGEGSERRGISESSGGLPPI